MQTRQPNLEGTGEIALRRLVKEALRMRPNRIVVGEVRQEECLDLLIALNSGLPGMCTLHANSAREALTKMCVLPLLAGENVSAAFVVPTVATSVDLVVQLITDHRGHRRVSEIVGVTGRVEGEVIETSELFVSVDGRLTQGGGYPPHEKRYVQAGFDLAELLGSDGRSWVR
jgi:pilus assembly protein CpaF